MPMPKNGQEVVLDRDLSVAYVDQEGEQHRINRMAGEKVFFEVFEDGESITTRFFFRDPLNPSVVFSVNRTAFK